MHKQYALFIGRWQPFHNGHDYIIRQKLNEGVPVLIACRDTPISESDPYPLEDRIEMIQKRFRGEDVEVIGIPDIESVNIGRKVGYGVNRFDVPEDIAGISATEIRRRMEQNDDSWEGFVPEEIASYLKRGKDQKGLVLWMTGLSGAGKSTIAELLAVELEERGYPVKVLDGDEVRTNLTAGLGFTKEDRDENIRRISYVAKSIADVKGIAIVAAISPYREAREKAKELVGQDRFLEIFVNSSLDTCIQRDTKGFYAKALSCEYENFTGVSDPYEEPENPDLILRTDSESPIDSLRAVLCHLVTRMYLVDTFDPED